MNDIEVLTHTNLQLLHLPRHVFDIKGAVRDRYEIPTNDCLIHYKMCSKRKKIGTVPRKGSGYYNHDIFIESFLEVFASDPNIRFTRYTFGFKGETGNYNVPTAKSYQEYILYLLRDQEMPIDIIGDYLNL